MKIKDLELTDEEFDFLIISIGNYTLEIVQTDDETLSFEKREYIRNILNGLQRKFLSEMKYET